MSIIICGGLKRTGSLAMFQVMREIVEMNSAGLGDFRGREINSMAKTWVNDERIRVLKYHRYRSALEPYKNEIKVVMTIRDPRDVLVSLMNKYGYTFDRAMISSEFKSNLDSYYMWKKKIHVDDLLIVKYEDFWNYREPTIHAVSTFMGYSLFPPDVQYISNKWSIAANIERSTVELEVTDPEHVAKRHIHNGSPGQWKDMLDDNQIEKVCLMYKYWMEDTKYTC